MNRVPDLALPMQHPKRVFIYRALELEIRLSYYDRVLKTLPQPFQEPSAGAMPDQAPGPMYEYEDPSPFSHPLSYFCFPYLHDFF
jgi:nuclear cap-binding protein subunit 1